MDKVNKIDLKEIKLRALGLVDIMLFNLLAAVLGALYITAIKYQVIKYSKTYTLLAMILGFCAIVTFTYRKYDPIYEELIIKMRNTHRYDHKNIYLYFAIIFLVPLLLVGVGLTLFRNYMYFSDTWGYN